MTDFDPTAKFKVSFFQECDELLLDVERLVQGLQQEDGEAVNSLFRAVHTVKGGAGMFKFTRLVNFAHLLENLLENLRSGKTVADDAIVGDVLRACDVLVDLVQDARGTVQLPLNHETSISEQLTRLAGSTDHPKTKPADIEDAANDGRYVVRFSPEASLFRRGAEPMLMLRELAEIGKTTVNCNISGLPAFDKLDVASCHLGWTVIIETAEPLSRLRQVFEFVEGSGKLEIIPERRRAERRDQKAIAVEQAAVRSMSSIRVDLDRIDKLVNHVGEIAIVQAMIDQQAGKETNAAQPQLVQAIAQLSQLIQGLQDSVMAIRAVPVGSVFARMTRLVRELATATGKRVGLNISGEETEIDKTVVEQLGDPLLHMIRNAVDHGIESPEDREKAGKRAEGRIDLTARQRGGQIIIEVTDDGRGLDRERIKKRALEGGLISDASVLSDDEINNLIFQPGFSTAETISDISGRGVGMDVVKRNIQKLGGRVTLRSEPGQGSRVTIALPLTLAILSGMIVRSGRGHYVIPLSNIIECMQAKPDQIKRLPDLGEMFRHRDRYVPLIRLGAVFNHATSAIDECPLIIVVDDEDGNTLGIAVNEITGQQQVVIKSVRDNLEQVEGISGATILGDGTVALILILTDLLGLHRARVTGSFKTIPQFNQNIKSIA